MATIIRVWRLSCTQFQGGKDGFYNTCSDRQIRRKKEYSSMVEQRKAITISGWLSGLVMEAVSVLFMLVLLSGIFALWYFIGFH